MFPQALGMFLAMVGVTHGLVPGYYERLVPRWVPAHRAVVLASGAIEVVLGVGLLFERTRPVAAVLTVVLFVGYVGAHVDAFLQSRRRVVADGFWLDQTPATVVRVAVNVAYVGWATSVALVSV